MIPLSTYLKTYRVGDIVDVVANGAVQKGMPYKVSNPHTCATLESHGMRQDAKIWTCGIAPYILHYNLSIADCSPRSTTARPALSTTSPSPPSA